MITATAADIERFMKYVRPLPCGCWFWIGGRSKGKGNKMPYGTFNIGGRAVRAHRFASEVLGGEEYPPGYHRDHVCCFSLCVNPACIEVVTAEENQRRKVARSALQKKRIIEVNHGNR